MDFSGPYKPGSYSIPTRLLSLLRGWFCMFATWRLLVLSCQGYQDQVIFEWISDLLTWKLISAHMYQKFRKWYKMLIYVKVVHHVYELQWRTAFGVEHHLKILLGYTCRGCHTSHVTQAPALSIDSVDLHLQVDQYSSIKRCIRCFTK